MNRVPARLFLLLTALSIAALSHQPSLSPPFQLFPHQDKLFHFLEFAGLALALRLNRDLFPSKGGVWLMTLSGLAWALLDELHQSYVPGRDCSLQDLAADATGLLVGLMVFSAVSGGLGSSRSHFPLRDDK